MALPTNTFTSYDALGQREDLTDIISNIDPVDTPGYSNFGKGKADAKVHEWQTDSLDDPDGDNAQLEGNDVDGDVIQPTERIGNLCQISEKSVTISETEEAVDKAGRDDEMSYQIAKKGKALRRDMETIFFRNQGAVQGAAATARRLGALPAIVKTNVDKEATGVNPVWTSLPTDVRTDGAQRAFTEDQVKNVCQLGWNEGANFKILMVGGFNKMAAAAFAGIADKVYNLNSPGQKVPIIGAVDVYVNDFHTLNIVPNRFQRARDAWFLDNSLISVRFLRKFKTVELGKTGDNDKRFMNVEYTLRVENEKGLGLVADLTTS